MKPALLILGAWLIYKLGKEAALEELGFYRIESFEDAQRANAEMQ